jgi:hypothetical protein
MANSANSGRRREYTDDARRQKDFRRRDLTGFDGLVSKAAWGEIDPLIAHLNSDAPLSAEDRRSLARLISWAQQYGIPRRRGRPSGRTPGDVREAEAFVVSFVKAQLNIWRREQGRKRAQKGMRLLMTQRGMRLAEAVFPAAKNKIAVKNILTGLKR